MNSDRRVLINKIIKTLEVQQDLIRKAFYQEESEYKNLPAAIQDGSKGEDIQFRLRRLQRAFDRIGLAVYDLKDALKKR